MGAIDQQMTDSVQSGAIDKQSNAVNQKLDAIGHLLGAVLRILLCGYLPCIFFVYCVYKVLLGTLLGANVDFWTLTCI